MGLRRRLNIHPNPQGVSVKATPAEQELVLRLQSVDLRLRQLNHKLSTLPQAAPLAEVAERDAALRRARADAVGACEDTKAELGRIESDVSIVEARIARDTERQQNTSSVKDVTGLESELVALTTRLANLEDQELIVMERVEDAENAIAALDRESEDVADERTRLEAERDAAAGELGSQLTAAQRDRGYVASDLPDALLARYEGALVRGGGIGAALLRQRTCGGCTITLTGSDLAAVSAAAPDEVLECPECDRILVRTDESGL